MAKFTGKAVYVGMDVNEFQGKSYYKVNLDMDEGGGLLPIKLDSRSGPEIISKLQATPKYSRGTYHLDLRAMKGELVCYLTGFDLDKTK